MRRNKDHVFIEAVWQYYAEHSRDLPWRHTTDPYHIFVSEIMLQQTQVGRVIDKYHQWLAEFPTVEVLASASPAEVITVWQGLGYNRRALFLHRAAGDIMMKHSGAVPDDRVLLEALPGVGTNTAGAILAYAFNQPVVFIETNIRRCYLHHYFPDHEEVSDADILPIIERTLDRRRPRQWYWALMDYGSMLARQVINPNRRSKHYTQQGRFAGSNRQLRGQILHRLNTSPATIKALQATCTSFSEQQIQAAVDRLTIEGFIERTGNFYRLQQ